MNLRQLVLVGLAALALGGAFAAQVGASAAQVPPPPPPPPGGGATPSVLPGTPVPTYTPPTAITPAPSSTPGGRRRRAEASPSASPSETPEPPQFSTMDGVWEVAVQPVGARTLYSHLYLTQKADQLSGTWARSSKDRIPFTGTFDGRLFKLTAVAGSITYMFNGYVENFSDMVGLLTANPPPTADARGIGFTAAHRKASKDKVI